MRKQPIIFAILITMLCAVFFGCEGMATLFHGPKPEDPPVVYTVTFYANGASGTPPEMQTVNSGTMIRLPDKGNLTSTGNIFTGWSESSSGIGTVYSVGASVTVTGDMVFYAQWLDSSTPQYTVTFNANGATGGSPPAAQTAYSGSSITIPAQGTLSLSGKKFDGWNTQANGGGTGYAAGATYTVTGNATLYAQWQSEVQYTVTYHANGATGTAPSAQTVDPGTVITLPGVGSLTYTGRTFDGWNTNAGGTGTGYAEGESYTVNENVSLYARWLSVPITPPGSTLAQQLAYIANNAGDGVVYDIVVDSDVYMGPATVSTLGRNITVIIRSASLADIKSIQLESVGHLFSVDTNITLKLQNIVLRGISMNNKALVLVGQGGKLILNSGSTITLNTNISGEGYGGGIYVNDGFLELNDGCEVISNTTNTYGGGGILLKNSGNIIMRGGIISENKVVAGSATGGGVCIENNSTMSMFGGIISKNQAGARGGGIRVEHITSTFTKRADSGSNTSGIIYGSTGDNANIAGSFDGGYGHAIHRNFSTKQYRNSTLGYYDEISTLSDDGWE
jgi:hypothetical protein